MTEASGSIILLLCTTVLVALLIVSAASAQAASASSVVGAVVASTLPWQRQSHRSYAASLSGATAANDLGIRFDSFNNSGAIAALTSGAADFALTSIQPSTLLARAGLTAPDLTMFPLAGQAVVIAYNCGPSAACSSLSLSLSRVQLCSIFRGNLTVWSQLATPIGAANLSVIVNNDPNDASTAVLSQFCSALDSAWAALLGSGTGTGVNWLNPSLNRTLPLAIWSSDGSLQPSNVTAGLDPKCCRSIAEYVVTVPYSIGYMTLSEAKANGLAIAAIVNAAGVSVSPIVRSVQFAVVEKCPTALVSKSLMLSLSLLDASNSQAYPLVGIVWLTLFQQYMRQSCAARQQLIEYIRWTLTSDMAANLATPFDTVILPSSVTTSILSTYFTAIVCDSAAVLLPQFVRTIATSIIAPTFIESLLPAVAAVNTSWQYKVTPMISSAVAAMKIPTHQADLALVSTLDWDATQAGSSLGDWVTSQQLAMLPIAFTSLRPIFRLPDAVVSTVNSTDTFSAPLFPLVLDIDTLGRVFRGLITSWLDVAIIRLNPSLPSRFMAAGASPNLTVIVCCSQPSAALTTTAASVSVMTSLSTDWRTDALAPRMPVSTTSWKALINRAANGTSVTQSFNVTTGNVTRLVTNTTLVNATGATYITALNQAQVLSLVRSTPGSVALVHTGTAMGEWNAFDRRVDDQSTFRLTSSSDPAVTTAFSESAVSACAAGFDTDNCALAVSALSSPQCWPLTIPLCLLSRAVFQDTPLSALGYRWQSQTDPSCSSGQDVIHTTEWLTGVNVTGTIDSRHFYTTVIAPNLRSQGLVPSPPLLSGVDLASIVTRVASCINPSGTLYKLYEAITVRWELAVEVQATGLVLASLGLLVCIGTSLYLARHGASSIVRSSSVSLLNLMLTGLACLFTAALLWLAPVSDATCSSFIWLVTLGLTLAFCPLFLRTWRIWRIFGRTKLSVVRITNRPLALFTTGILIVDIIVLSVLQAQEPFRAMDYTEQSVDSVTGAVTDTIYRHCSVPWTAGSRGFILVESVLKGCLFAFGGVMAFWTRHVDTQFNESINVALTLYNSLFSLGLVVPLTVLIGALGDTLIGLILAVLLWVACGSWLLIFVPLISRIAQAQGNEKAKLSYGQSLSLTPTRPVKSSKATHTGEGPSTSSSSAHGESALVSLHRAQRSNAAHREFAFPDPTAMSSASLAAYLGALQDQVQRAKKQSRQTSAER